jgi:hypothetical protein
LVYLCDETKQKNVKHCYGQKRSRIIRVILLQFFIGLRSSELCTAQAICGPCRITSTTPQARCSMWEVRHTTSSAMTSVTVMHLTMTSAPTQPFCTPTKCSPLSNNTPPHSQTRLVHIIGDRSVRLHNKIFL